MDRIQALKEYFEKYLTTSIKHKRHHTESSTHQIQSKDEDFPKMQEEEHDVSLSNILCKEVPINFIINVAEISKEDTEIETADIAEKLFMGQIPPREEELALYLGIWEYVIVMPNPEKHPTKRHTITQAEASKVFKKAFYVSENSIDPEQKYCIKSDKRSFLKVFNRLRPHGDANKFFAYAQKSHSSRRITETISEPRDFLTLMRNVILVKLAFQLRLLTKMVLSSNSEYIYILIATTERVLEEEAARINYELQLEVSLTDYMSLEPCDTKLHPYFFSDIKSPKIKELLKKLQPFYAELLDPDVLNKLGKVYKTSNHKENRITKAQWESYCEYLDKLLMGYEMIPADMPIDLKKIYYRKLIINTLNDVNEDKNSNARLYTLWDRFKISQPLGAYTDFIRKRKAKGAYQISDLWRLYKINELGDRSKFKNIDRIKLLNSILGRQMSIPELKARGIIIDSFPIKNNWILYGKSDFPSPPISSYDSTHIEHLTRYEGLTKFSQPLYKKWDLKYFSTEIPMNGIKNYFGEKIAMYFGFLAHFTNMLILPGVIGAIIFIVQLSVGMDTSPILVINAIYCFFISVWATFFIEFWRRKEGSLAVLWGQLEYKHDEVPRPQYRGELRRSPINDDFNEEFFNPLKRMSFYMFGITVSTSVVLLILGMVAGITILRWQITESLTFNGFDFAGPVCSTLNAVQIQIFNSIYHNLAFKLTDMENHRTQSSYENSFIVKTYLFEFINNFNSVFYIAFVKSRLEGCIVDDGQRKVRKAGASCMNELYIQLGALFLVFFLKNIIELGLPWVQKNYKKKMQNRIQPTRNISLSDTALQDTTQAKPIHPSAQQSDLFEPIRVLIDDDINKSSYNERHVDGTLSDYQELAVLFGYMVLFNVAFPIAGLLSYVLLIIEMRVDRYKLLSLVKRPHPVGGKDIGTWCSIFNLISVMSLFTNPAIICFTSNTFETWNISGSTLYFIYAISVCLLILIRAWLRTSIPHIPEKYNIILKRHETIIEKYLRGDRDFNKYRLHTGNIEINPQLYARSYMNTYLSRREV
jgi:hypothetical protein